MSEDKSSQYQLTEPIPLTRDGVPIPEMQRTIIEILKRHPNGIALSKLGFLVRQRHEIPVGSRLASDESRMSSGVVHGLWKCIKNLERQGLAEWDWEPIAKKESPPPEGKEIVVRQILHV